MNAKAWFGEVFFLFQHDNAPVYRAGSRKKLFSEFVMEEFDCPAH